MGEGKIVGEEAGGGGGGGARDKAVVGERACLYHLMTLTNLPV